MKKTILLIASVLLMVSCGEAVQKPAKVAEKVAPKLTEKNETPQARLVEKSNGKKETANIPMIEDHLDQFPLMEPEFKALKAEYAWQRHQGFVKIDYIDSKTILTTNDSVFKSKIVNMRVLDDIGADIQTYSTYKSTMGGMAYDDYVSHGDKYISVVSSEGVSVYDIFTHELYFSYPNNPPFLYGDRWYESAKIVGELLYVANSSEILCFNLTTKHQKFSIKLKDISKNYVDSTGHEFRVSFIGWLKGNLFILINSDKSMILKVSGDGNFKVIMDSLDSFGEERDPEGINERYICMIGGSYIYALDIVKEEVFPVYYNGGYSKNFLFGNYLLLKDSVFDLDQRKPVVRFKEELNCTVAGSLFLFTPDKKTLYCYDLSAGKQVWKVDFHDNVQLIKNLKSNQATVVADKNFYFIDSKSPTSWWQINIAGNQVADLHKYEQEIVAGNIKTQTADMNNFAYNSWFDVGKDMVYLIGEYDSDILCIMTKETPVLTVVPVFSDVKWGQGDYNEQKPQPKSMDIFVTWRGSEPAKAVLEYNSPENAKHRSEFELKPNVQTRVQIWFDHKGQKLTVDGVTHNIYNYQTVGAD